MDKVNRLDDRKRGADGQGEEVEVYMLKIYRRSKNPSQSLVGTIEDIRGQRGGKFKTPVQLIRCLKHPEVMVETSNQPE